MSQVKCELEDFILSGPLQSYPGQLVSQTNCADWVKPGGKGGRP